MKQDIELRPGMYVTGKWHNKRYLIKRKLGSGTVGTVYLCESAGKQHALKISKQSASMTVEVNVLKALSRVQGYRLGPSLVDVDDWKQRQGLTYSFYVMEYLEGERIDRFIKKNGPEWIGVLMLQLLEDLEKLHQLGWVFGDLKVEHLIVRSSPPRICFMDVGGTTQMGRSIKEYTEFYDRGYWGLGTRRAEPSYDLFAFSMIFIAIFYPNHFPRSSDSAQTILKRLSHIQALDLYYDCLKKALLGRYTSSAAMKQDILRVLYHQQREYRRKSKSHIGKESRLFVESGGILLIATVYYLTSLFY